ncbi:glycosyltransferase [Acidipila rosea]|uniref:Glycosyltransferase involved in cell wall biosynthesis n=1 Tax=Acidipila rosea TaxID=768535 RepID=A0A4R1L1C9_9BACT|nr:glycosyltransferase [Acidipila rosea]TCK71736.1 glycosyltransferase involved in cell wall biosynthesis [Acidipila rosea]
MPQKILHLIGSNSVGGPEKQILHHAVDLQDSPFEVEVGSFHDLAEKPEILVEAERRGHSTVCLSGGLKAGLITELAGILRARPGVILCTHGFKANVLGYLATRRTKTPHVAFVRGWTAETWRVRLYEMLERQALARAQWVVCVSHKQAVEVGRRRKGSRAPMVVCNAMLPPFSRAGGVAVSREKLGIPAGAFVYGSVGRLSAEKGHRYMLEAFYRVCERTAEGDKPFLIVVGDGREQAPLEAQAASLGLRERIHFAGYQGNCSDWMKLMDCMVQPSLTEGTPNSVLEALCLQLPVVATAVGGVPDLIVHNRNGLLVPPADAKQLGEAMQTVAASPSLREKLRSGGAMTAEEYSPLTQRRKLLEVYERVLRAEGVVARDGAFREA